jgi:hypothetical protein
MSSLSLYVCQGSDTVHDDMIAYSKIANGLLENFNKKLPGSNLRHNIFPRKCPRDKGLSSKHSSKEGGNEQRNSLGREGGYYRSNRDYPSSHSSSSTSNRDSLASGYLY